MGKSLTDRDGSIDPKKRHPPHAQALAPGETAGTDRGLGKVAGVGGNKRETRDDVRHAWSHERGIGEAELWANNNDCV